MNRINSAIRVVLLTSVPVIACGGASARGLGAAGGETCAQATLIPEGSYAGDTSLATNDGNANCSESSTSPDVWYRFVPVTDGVLRLDMCGSAYDTMLSVHSGCPGDDTNAIACNDDFDCDGDGQTQDDGFVSVVQVPVNAGTPYTIRVSGWDGASGAYVLDVSLGPDFGADVLIGEINQFLQFGRVGDVVGCATDSPVCNAGTQPLDWYPLVDGRHPFMVVNMYRLENDRIIQIGQSWVKHGFSSAQGNSCGLGCVPHPNSTRTGVGCSDTYSAGTNANRSFLGPRHEIDPWMPSYTYAGSHLDLEPGAHDAIEHRLQIRDADLETSLSINAQFICEVYVLAHDDADHLNSIAHEPVIVAGVPGGTWSFDVSAPASELGPAISAWPGASVSIIPEVTVDDGRVNLAAKAIDQGNGRWRYEYALYNHDMARAVGSFGVPVDAGADVTGIGFRAVASHDEPFANDAWTSTRTPTGVTWSTEAFDINPLSNPLRWGTTYNFWFESDRAPADASVTLTPYFPGPPGAITGQSTGPSSCSADVDGNGFVDVSDITYVVFRLGNTGIPGTVDGDADANGSVEVSDITYVIFRLGSCT